MQKINCPFGTATLSVYPCKGGAAVVICPGGGYRFTSPREAEPIAKAWNRAGFAAFVLDYDCSTGERLDTLPLRQLAWAVKTIRERAEEFECTQQVAVCGFSAGGHLAASLGVFWADDERFDETTTANQRRPDAMVLSYPVISAGEFAHLGSFLNLAGEEKSEQAKWSLENFVTEKVPPVFVWHTMDDEAVPVENTLLLSKALRKYQVSHEVHLFPHGVHGLSLATEEVNEEACGRMADPHVAHWFELATEWLKSVLNK
ncbi:acetyl esterase [Sporanaerobium hydrogeniformans]|uniref:Acetyl esterase n=1 Tax=Sporanaerobium hydrogeniformans TaxID=3072179 RepID=A0AC61DAP1_9FIRM|nr:alpha/beta hydrolase [Sporanaerobium hydrogeniformans]PHV70092.1 acetyl esterase [Sporanaerobium hydrogeniformans]